MTNEIKDVLGGNIMRIALTGNPNSGKTTKFILAPGSPCNSW